MNQQPQFAIDYLREETGCSASNSVDGGFRLTTISADGSQPKLSDWAADCWRKSLAS